MEYKTYEQGLKAYWSHRKHNDVFDALAYAVQVNKYCIQDAKVTEDLYKLFEGGNEMKPEISKHTFDVFDQCVNLCKRYRAGTNIDDYIVKIVDDKSKEYIMVTLFKKKREVEMRVNKRAKTDQVDSMMYGLVVELNNRIQFEEYLEPARPKTVYEQTVDICKKYAAECVIDRWSVEEENGAVWVTLYIGNRGFKWWIGQLTPPITIEKIMQNLVDEVREAVSMDKNVSEYNKKPCEPSSLPIWELSVEQRSRRIKFVNIVREHCPKLQHVMDYSGYGFDTDTYKMYRIEDEFFITNMDTLLTVNWYKNLGRCWQSSLPTDYEGWENELILFFADLSREIEELEGGKK